MPKISCDELWEQIEAEKKCLNEIKKLTGWETRTFETNFVIGNGSYNVSHGNYNAESLLAEIKKRGIPTLDMSRREHILGNHVLVWPK